MENYQWRVDSNGRVSAGSRLFVTRIDDLVSPRIASSTRLEERRTGTKDSAFFRNDDLVDRDVQNAAWDREAKINQKKHQAERNIDQDSPQHQCRLSTIRERRSEQDGEKDTFLFIIN